ncbi:dipeptidyl peptidase 4-like isoform X2 [Eleutherodactylus coqui]|uniref:dipeptidyl peptidase 4-like isoform X2 n=1 Tax=Eleutherodactylus coqui TaxID=57060 RepID=UPI00346244C8
MVLSAELDPNLVSSCHILCSEETPSARTTWVKWLIGLLAGAVVVIAIAVPVALLATKGEEGKSDNRRTYTLDDYFGDQLRYKSYGLQWISGNEYLHRTRDYNVIVYNVDTQETTVLLSNITIDRNNESFYELSADRKYALLQYNYEKVWRHSFKASYRIIDVDTKQYITANELPQMIQYITWSPVGRKLVYVWENDIYIRDSPEQQSIRITHNGEENKILNGIPDWVYEEEMFSTNNAIWWSPNGQMLSYAVFNDTEVPIIEYTFYGDESEQYPQTIHIPYPKAGTKNPTVRLFSVNTELLDNVTVVEILAPNEIISGDHYLSTVTWASDQRMAIQWLRRIQNVSILTLCSYSDSDWQCSTPLYEESKTGWVGNFGPSEPYFTSPSMFYKIVSNAYGYKHVHPYGLATRPGLTNGSFEVTSIIKVVDNDMYYISNKGAPSKRHLYKLNLNYPFAEQCVTCNLRPERCEHYSTYFSKNGEYYSLSCNGPGIPIYTLHNSTDGREIKILESNAELEVLLDDIQLPTKERNSINHLGFDLWYQLTLPPHFDKSKKYPLLIDVYGGPCSQKVDQYFRLNWATYLASTEKIIVASFDGRGSGYQGDKILYDIYRRLGTIEVEDQIAAARHFKSLGFVDEKRIAIWGWSYGGYVTSMVLGSGSGEFKCGIAVAPVSSWHYYDSIYTERYMSLPTPEDNLQNYDSSTVMARAAKFKDVGYLLIHGTADDNVHFQQAAQISKALVDAGVDFDTMWYTDKDHGIGGLASRHIYTHMSHYLKQCFNIQ